MCPHKDCRTVARALHGAEHTLDSSRTGVRAPAPNLVYSLMPGADQRKEIALSNQKILVVDPNVTALDRIAHVLSSAGYAPLTRTDLTTTHAVAREKQPALIILKLSDDDQRPRRNLLAALMDDPTTTDIPVLLIGSDASFRQEPIGVIRRYRGDWLPEPCDPETLLHKVRTGMRFDLRRF